MNFLSTNTLSCQYKLIRCTVQCAVFSTCTLYTIEELRIKTENKAQVVAAAWGAEFINFLAELLYFLPDDLNNRMNCTRLI